MNITPDGTTSLTADLYDPAALWRVFNAAKAAYESAPGPEEFREGTKAVAEGLRARLPDRNPDRS